MPATILTHPRLDADTATRASLSERLADLLAHEELLRWQVAPEAEADYWRLFGDLETAQVAARGSGAARRAARRTASRRQDAETRRAQAPLPETGRRAFVATHRRLVRCLHPQLDRDAGCRGYLWAMVRRACRDGDLVRLRECEAAIRDEADTVAPLPETVLRSALADAQGRIRRLEAQFPLNLRAWLSDPDWVAERRAALRRRLPETACRVRG